MLFIAVKMQATNTHLEQVLAQYNDSLSTAKSIQDSIRLYTKVSDKCIRINAQKSVELGEKAIQLASSIDDKKLVADIKFIVAIPLLVLDEFEKAEDYLIYSRSYYTKHKMKNELSEVMILYGWYFIRIEKYITAIDTLNFALDLKKELNDERGIRNINNRFGIIYRRVEEYEKAKQYYLKIVNDALNSENKSYLTAAAYNVAYLFLKQKDQENAKKYFKISMKNRSAKGMNQMDNVNKGYYFSSEAEIAKIDGSMKEAMRLQDTSIYYFNVADDPFAVRGGLFKKTAYHIELKNFEKAAQLLDEANQMDVFKSLSYYSSYAERKSEIFSGLNQPDSALLYYKKHIEAKDGIAKENYDKQLVDYETKIERERNIKEQELLKLGNRTLKNNFLIALSFLSLIIFLVYRHSKRTEITNALLKEKNEIIATSLEEKETLLKEIHHRVKNNLQIVSSMLNLQSRHIEDKEALQAITDSRNRVRSIALIHQNLYKKNSLNSILISPYIRNLCQSLFHSYKVDEKRIKLTTDIAPLDLDVDTGIPLGLIINELITNSVKYAFPNDKKGEIFVSLLEKDNYLELIVKDDGIGLDKEIDVTNIKSFGYSLIGSLAKKIKASIDVNGENGMYTRLEIRKFTKK